MINILVTLYNKGILVSYHLSITYSQVTIICLALLKNANCVAVMAVHQFYSILFFFHAQIPDFQIG